MRVTLKQWWVTVMECRNGLLSLLQTLRELNVKTESWKNSIKNTEKWASCDENVGSLSISWSLCGRSVRARVCQVVAAPWPSASPQRPVMTSQKWGRRLRVAGTCAWTCSWRNHPGPTVGQWNWCEKQACSRQAAAFLRTEMTLLTFSAWTSIWLLDVVTMTSSGEKSCTSTVNWYESPRALIFPAPPKSTTKMRVNSSPQEEISYRPLFFYGDLFSPRSITPCTEDFGSLDVLNTAEKKKKKLTQEKCFFSFSSHYTHSAMFSPLTAYWTQKELQIQRARQAAVKHVFHFPHKRRLYT